MTPEQLTAHLEAIHAAYPPSGADPDPVCQFACDLKPIVCDGRTPDLCQRVKKVIEERGCDCGDPPSGD